MKKHWVLSYPLSALRRLWSDWADAQADLSLRWAHSHFIGFVMRRFILWTLVFLLFFLVPGVGFDCGTPYRSLHWIFFSGYIQADVILISFKHRRPVRSGGWGWGGGCAGMQTFQLAGQIILKSCSFSPETEFTPLILASKSEFS